MSTQTLAPDMEKKQDTVQGTQMSAAQKTDMDKVDPHLRKKTRAEILFDKAVYGGISYAAQAASGIILTHWMKFGGGRKHYDKIANWLGPNFISKIKPSKTGAAAIKEADSWITVTTMVMMGNLFLLPVKWLENRKPKIVRWLNDKQNEKHPPSEQERAEQEKSLALLDREPKQTWGSLLGGRAFGLAAVYGVLYGIGTKNNETAEIWSANQIIKGTEKVGLKKLAASKTYENYLRIGFYDVLYSMVSAGGLYIYSHFINPPQKRNKKDESGETPVLETTPVTVTDTGTKEKTWSAREENKSGRNTSSVPASSFAEAAKNTKGQEAAASL
jgi:hypothetical protein